MTWRSPGPEGASPTARGWFMRCKPPPDQSYSRIVEKSLSVTKSDTVVYQGLSLSLGRKLWMGAYLWFLGIAPHQRALETLWVPTGQRNLSLCVLQCSWRSGCPGISSIPSLFCDFQLKFNQVRTDFFLFSLFWIVTKTLQQYFSCKCILLLYQTLKMHIEVVFQ